MIKYVYSSCKVLVILVRLMKLDLFRQIFEKKLKYHIS
jgi:hypothetical protein